MNSSAKRLRKELISLRENPDETIELEANEVFETKIIQQLFICEL